MPQNVSILQLTGAAVLAAATVVWVAGLTRILRHTRRAAAELGHGRPRPMLRAVPGQSGAAPARESVALSPAEQDAFAVLVRQLGGR
ncbi:hypothetical protein AB0F77_05100 [Streptomyces sp. NPDC026672]|uniref:hypothetical protein n=1 Tax=unclassified Streptomyces TaxID=2593676 RepID=UPI0033C8C584